MQEAAKLLRHLPFFMAVAEERSFRQAADRLNIVQPALSRRVKELEAGLGVTLFDRLPRGLRLTDAGQTLLEAGTRAMEEFEQGCRRATSAAQGQIGKLRIFLTDAALSNEWLTTCIQNFGLSNPEIRIELNSAPPDQQLEGIGRGEFDIGFLNLSPAETVPCNIQRLSSEDIVLVVPNHHRFARMDKLFIRDLRDEPLLWTLRRTSKTFTDNLMNAFISSGVKPRIVMELTSFEQLVSTVDAGFGIGFTLQSRAHNLPGTMVSRIVEDLDVIFEFAMIWPLATDSLVSLRFRNSVLSCSERRSLCET